MSAPCDQLLEALGKGALSPEQARHLESCPSCTQAQQAHRALGEANPAPLSLERANAILALAARELAAHPRARSWRAEAAVAVALSATVALVGALKMGHGQVQNSASPDALRAAALALGGVLVLAGWFAFAPRARRAQRAVLAGGLLTVVAVAAMGSGQADPRPFLAAGAHCLMLELGVSALPVMAALLLLRGWAPDPLRSALVGLSGGAAGLIGLHFHCPNGTPGHLLTFHLLPWVAWWGLAALARARLRTHSFAP